MPSLAPRIDQLERNLKINGNFDLWQRGSSIAVSNAAKYTADRWLLSVNSASYTVTATPSTDVPTVAQSGFQSVNSLLLTNGTAPALSSGDRIYLNYRIEGYDYQNIHGKRMREQLWVKTSVPGTYSVALLNGAGTRGYVTTFTAASAATWTAIPLDLPLDSSGTWAFDNSIGLSVFILLTAGSSLQTSSLNSWGAYSGFAAPSQVNWAGTTGATFQIAQSMTIPQDFTQAGSANVIIPFQRCGRNFSEELAKAQRYYETSYDLGVAPGSVNSNGRYLTTGVGSAQRPTCAIPFKMTKRATPTVVTYSPGTGASGMYRNENASLDAASLIQQIGLGAFSFQPNDTPTAGHAVSVHWAADAEV